MQVIQFKDASGALKTLDIEGKTSVVIGSSEDCDLVIKGEGILSKHMTLEYEAGAWHICQVEVTNNIFVEGKNIGGAKKVKLAKLNFKVGDYEFSALEEQKKEEPKKDEKKKTAAPAPDATVKLKDMQTMKFDGIDQTIKVDIKPQPETAKLFITPKQSEKTDEFEITKDKVIIGRKEDCDIVLKDGRASRYNTRITKEGSSWFIEDMGSTNGTLLNNEKVAAKTKFYPGDEIMVGDTAITLKISGSGGGARPSDQTIALRPDQTVVLKGKIPASKKPGMNKKLVIGGGAAAAIVLLAIIVKLSMPTYKGATDQPAVDHQAQGQTTDLQEKISQMYEKAQSYAEKKDYQRASEELEKILVLDPSNQQVMSFMESLKKQKETIQLKDRARTEFSLGNLSVAQELASNVLQAIPDDTDMKVLMLDIEKKTQEKTAKAQFDEAMKLFNDADYARSKEQFSKIPAESAYYTKAQSQLKEIAFMDKARSVLEKAQELFKQGDSAGALQQIESLGTTNIVKVTSMRDTIMGVVAAQDEAQRAKKANDVGKQIQKCDEIMQLAPDTDNYFHKWAKTELDGLKTRTVIIVHKEFQSASVAYAAHDYLKAYEYISSALKFSPDWEEALALKEKIDGYIKDAGKYVFQAGYVLENDDLLMAKKIWRRLLKIMPAANKYSIKAKAKVAT